MAHVLSSDLLSDTIGHNYRLCKEDMAQEREFLRSVPLFPNISLTTHCNMVPRCSMCLTVDDAGHIQPIIHEKLAASLFLSSPRIAFTIDGEPTIYPDIEKVIQEVQGWAVLQTNGLSALFKKPSFLDNLWQVSVSLDAANAKTYAKFRPNHFDKVIDNVRFMSQYRKGRSCLNRLRIDYIIMQCTKHEVFDFIDLAVELEVDTVYYSYLFPLPHPVESRIINGFEFNYIQQLVPTAEIITIMDECVRYGTERGLTVIVGRPDRSGDGG